MASPKATCSVHLLQAGDLSMPASMFLLPAPNTPQPYTTTSEANADLLPLPVYTFLLTHHPTGKHYLFDLGMRPNATETSPPALRKNLKNMPFRCNIVNPIDVLNGPANSTGVKPKDIEVVIFSHMHFDHTGNVGRGFENAELWLGPTCCTAARPGYPKDPEHTLFEADLPSDGSRKLVEWTIPEEELARAGDPRAGQADAAVKEGKYAAVERRVPARGWEALGPFERAADVFGDGSFWLVDAPGHYAGHQLGLAKVRAGGGEGGGVGGGTEDGKGEDEYVLLCGDAYHHPGILKEPGLMARPPFSFEGRTMHPAYERSLDSVGRIKKWAGEENVWAVAAHDGNVGKSVGAGEGGVEGMVCLDDWKRKGWKGVQV